MKRILLTAAMILILALGAAAQDGMKLGAIVGGGVVMPQGDLKDFYKMGFNGGVGLGIEVHPMFTVYGKFFYDILGKDEDAGTTDDAKVMEFLGDVHFYPPIGSGEGAFAPYLVAGAGMASLDSGGDTEKETKLTFGFGAGFEYTLSPKMALWVEGKYMKINVDEEEGEEFNASHIPIRAGLKFNFGGGE